MPIKNKISSRYRCELPAMSHQLTAHTSYLRRIRPRRYDRRRNSVRGGRAVAELAEVVATPTHHAVVRRDTAAVRAAHGDLLEREAGHCFRRCGARRGDTVERAAVVRRAQLIVVVI